MTEYANFHRRMRVLLRMASNLHRLAYAIEFLVAVLATFTAWSEIGGQDALDAMHWGWKLGFGLALSAAVVGYTAAITTSEGLWTMRSARWLTLILVLLAGMGVVTYFYVLQVASSTETDEPGTISSVMMVKEDALS
jgi:hypothetical protein